MNARSKSPFSLLPLALSLAAPLAAQDRPQPIKPIAHYVVDADRVEFVRDADATGCAIVLVSLEDRTVQIAPLLPKLLADAQVFAVALWQPDVDADKLKLQVVKGMPYHAQLVLFDANDFSLHALLPVLVAESDDPAYTRAKPAPVESEPAETDRAASPGRIEPQDPKDPQPSLDELASQMTFWIDRPRGASYAKLRVDFRTSRAGYAWSRESTVRETADGIDAFFVLQTPSGPSGYLFAEAHLQTSVPVPMRASGVRIFLALVDDAGDMTDFVQIHEL